jgi:hypothetical protein
VNFGKLRPNHARSNIKDPLGRFSPEIHYAVPASFFLGGLIKAVRAAVLRAWLGVPGGHPVELYRTPPGIEPQEDTGLRYEPEDDFTKDLERRCKERLAGLRERYGAEVERAIAQVQATGEPASVETADGSEAYAYAQDWASRTGA